VNRWVKFGLGIAISVASMGWALKDTFKVNEVTGIRPIDLAWNAVISASWASTLAIYLVALTIIHLARVLRWGNLLSGLEEVPFKKLNEASAIGFMMLVVLPFRLGEFARPFLIAERSKIRRSPAMTTVVLERIADLLIIAVLLRIMVIFVPDTARDLEKVRLGANLMLLVSLSGFGFLLLARWKHELVVGLLRKVFAFLGPVRAEKIVNIVDGFVGALRQLPDAKNLALFFFWTLLYWFVNGVAMAQFANGFDCSGAAGRACLPLHIDVFQGFFLLCVLIVGMMIPAGPAGAGTTQAALLVGMGVFLPDELVNSSGLAFAIVLWLVQVIQQIAFGLFFLARSDGSFSDIAGKLNAQQSKEAT
jgi:glycosyltransferase 2 family protein